MLNRWPYLILLIATMAAAQMQKPAMAGVPPDVHASRQSSSAVECPWFTRGTAAAVLGGKVSLTARIDGYSAGSCVFQNQQNPLQTLTIVVSRMAPPACRKKSISLTGIANWASLCSISKWHHRHTETVTGQARNTYFTVTLAFQQKRKWRQRDTQVENAAAMVAGNLY
jgi:hypothetical protein